MGPSKLKLHKTTVEALPPAPEEEGLSSFAAESEPARKAQGPAGHSLRRSRNIPYLAAAFGAVLIVAAGTVAFFATRPARGEARTSTAAAPQGNAFIDSRPPGATVFIDGIAQGTTPVKVVHHVFFDPPGARAPHASALRLPSRFTARSERL